MALLAGSSWAGIDDTLEDDIDVDADVADNIDVEEDDASDGTAVNNADEVVTEVVEAGPSALMISISCMASENAILLGCSSCLILLIWFDFFIWFVALSAHGMGLRHSLFSFTSEMQ